MTSDIPTEGRIEAGRHLLPVRVYYEDTDLTGIVYHANYLRYMERGRTEMLRHAGVDHNVAMAAGDGFLGGAQHEHHLAPAGTAG